MGYFPYPLVLKCISKEKSRFRFEVYEKPFCYVTDKGEIIRIPVGFKTDFASVPTAFSWLVSRTGIYNEATVVHDYLCYEANKVEDDRLRKAARKKADKLFLEAMKSLGVGTLKRGIMYRGVRTFSMFKLW